tara:strand:+ start:1061 stop:1519 length:459 start_codon:yes stop_codon:yes gene_type:complete
MPMDRRDYYNSSRWWEEVSPDRRKVTLRFDYPEMDDSLSEEEVEEILENKPWYHIKWIVCSICDGRGEYVNPSIDSNGLSREDFDEDPEFRQDYFSGVYNMTCELCQGRAVQPEFDEDYTIGAKELMKARDNFLNMLHEWDAEEYMERSMGA